MPDEPQVIDPAPEPVVDPPAPDPPPAPPPPDPAMFDDRGVPWRNVAAESQRKLQEALDRQAQQQYRTPPPAPVVEDEMDAVLKNFSPEVHPALRSLLDVFEKRAKKIAQQEAQAKGYQMITQVTQQNAVAENPALLEEARRQYTVIAQNPAFRGSEEIMNELALEKARTVLAQRQPAARPAAQQQQPPPQLPPTRGAAPQPAATDKETYIKKFMNDPQNLLVARKVYGPKFDPNSAEGQRKLRESAEIEFNEGGVNMWGGGVKSAVNAIMREAQRGQ